MPYLCTFRNYMGNMKRKKKKKKKKEEEGKRERDGRHCQIINLKQKVPFIAALQCLIPK